MGFKEVRFTATDSVITIYYGNDRRQITKHDKPKDFDEIKALLRSATTDPVKAEKAIIARLKGGQASKIVKYSRNQFVVDHGGNKVIDKSTGTDVGTSLAKRILHWEREGLPFEPLLRFHRRVITNPSTSSAADLYSFLEANHIPITDDGMFIAYKRVTRMPDGALRDSHTKKIANEVGTVVSMPRADVDGNRDNTCSSGLHIGAFQYVKEFTGNVTIEVKVDPADVVAVPPDYNQQKMRVCRYQILRQVGDGETVRTSQMVKTRERNSAGEHDIEDAPAFEGMTAREIVAWVETNLKERISLDLKNKKAIVKKAYAIFAEVNGDDGDDDDDDDDDE